MPVVMREVIEWHRLDIAAGQVPDADKSCLFADEGGRTWIGEWRRSGDDEYAVVRSLNGMQKMPPGMQAAQMAYFAHLETGSFGDRLRQLVTFESLDRERKGGDTSLCSSIDHRGFTRTFIVALDRKIVRAYQKGQTFRDFVRAERMQRGTPKHTVAKDLWEARYGMRGKTK